MVQFYHAQKIERKLCRVQPNSVKIYWQPILSRRISRSPGSWQIMWMSRWQLTFSEERRASIILILHQSRLLIPLKWLFPIRMPFTNFKHIMETRRISHTIAGVPQRSQAGPYLMDNRRRSAILPFRLVSFLIQLATCTPFSRQILPNQNSLRFPMPACTLSSCLKRIGTIKI